jgi:hypothetical protein
MLPEQELIANGCQLYVVPYSTNRLYLALGFDLFVIQGVFPIHGIGSFNVPLGEIPNGIA